MKPVILPTELVIVWLAREGVSAAHARRFLYRHSYLGNLTRYGGSERGTARWDLREVRDLMWPRTQDEHPLPDAQVVR